MPSIEEHWDHARHNEDFANSFDLTSTPFRDWAVTGLFYAALHYVNALLHHLGRADPDIDRHPKVEALLRRHPAVARNFGFRADYKDLKNDSEEARYRCYMHPEADVRALANGQLARIRQFVDAMIR